MSRRRSSTTKNLDESSVLVQDSPVSSIKQKGNLTGNARVMRDHVFEMESLIQAWNEEVLDGTTWIAEIKSIMLKKINAKESDTISYMSLLQTPCNTLNEICTKMEKIVKDMGQLITRISAVSKLEKYKESQRLMFLTWSSSKFVEISQQIYEMYRRELTMKVCVKEELCFCTNQDMLIFLETAWLQEPYIDRCVSLNHEAMLKEVGH